MNQDEAERKQRWDIAFATYRAANEEGRWQDEAVALRALSEIAPQIAWPYFDLGLIAKRQRDWSEAARLNQRSLEVEAEESQDPAAWNLGIAATALGRWDVARQAWRAYGLNIGEGTGPIREDFGLTPVRINPEPRFPGEKPVEINGQRFDATEVVWTRRLSPASALILSLPLPASGHRYGDVVLHDGDPVGTRRDSNGGEVPVFNEIALLERSSLPTWTVLLDNASNEDCDALQDLALARGGYAENWTQSVVMLCRACSEGEAGASTHEHAPAASPVAGEREVGVALEEADLRWALHQWLVGRPGVQVRSAEQSL